MWYTEQRAKDCVTNFLDQLKLLNEDIEKRNEMLLTVGQTYLEMLSPL